MWLVSDQILSTNSGSTPQWWRAPFSRMVSYPLRTPPFSCQVYINTNLAILPRLNLLMLSPHRLDHSAIKRWSFRALLQLDCKCMQSVYSALVSANLINKSACTIIMATGCAVIARNNCLIGQRALNSINTTSRS